MTVTEPLSRVRRDENEPLVPDRVYVQIVDRICDCEQPESRNTCNLHPRGAGKVSVGSHDVVPAGGPSKGAQTHPGYLSA